MVFPRRASFPPPNAFARGVQDAEKRPHINNDLDNAINQPFTDQVLDKILADVDRATLICRWCGHSLTIGSTNPTGDMHAACHREAKAEYERDMRREDLVDARRQKPILDDDHDGMRDGDGFGGDKYDPR